MSFDTLKHTASGWKERFHEWNANRWHMPDIYEHHGFKVAATVITHIGFFAKAILYGSMGVVAMLAATSRHKREPEGPQNVIVDLRTTFGEIIVTILTIGLFCYSMFALFFCIFDIDRLGHHGAMPILSRFGRAFSAGFYFFIGIVGAQTVKNIHRNSDLSSKLGDQLFSTTGGKCVVVFLGVVFLVVAIVYLIYAIRPGKFYRELASERMHPILFYACVTIARIGACGRILFFGAFGVVLIDAVANDRGLEINGTSVLGLEGVLLKIANFSSTLLFVTGGLLFVYAFWCFILCIFRRLPAHYSMEASVHALGTRWRVRKVELQQRRLKKKGMEVPITGIVNMPPSDLEKGKSATSEDELKPGSVVEQPVFIEEDKKMGAPSM